MLQGLEEDESFLNFSYLTAAFYNFFEILSKNLEKNRFKGKRKQY